MCPQLKRTWHLSQIKAGNEFGFLITDGEVNLVKIYTANNTANDGVEILLNYQELKKLINSLKKFEDEVKQFKTKNKEAEGLGFTHLHLKDCGLIDKNSK